MKNRHPDRGEALFDETGKFTGHFDLTDEEWEAFLKAVDREHENLLNIAWQVRVYVLF